MNAITTLGIVSMSLFAVAAAAQTAKDVKGATPLVAVPNEAPPKLIVDPPIPEQLAQGRVFIQYRTENLRILPVFGNQTLRRSKVHVRATQSKCSSLANRKTHPSREGKSPTVSP